MVDEVEGERGVGNGKRERGSMYEYVLFQTHPLPLFQVRARAEAFVDLAREDQYPGPGAEHGALFRLFFPGQFTLGLFLHGVDLVREFREQLAGDGVAGAGVVETEDADVAEVRGGDVVRFYEGRGWGGGGEADMAVESAFDMGLS